YVASPRCVSSRAAYFSGRAPDRPDTKGKGGLGAHHTTVAEALHEGGYRTYFLGKWHLGIDDQLPENQGFDVNIAGGKPGAPPTYWFPYLANDKGQSGEGPVPHLADMGGEEGEYLTDRLTDEAIGLLRDHQANHAQQPFLLWLSHYGVHTPIQAKADKVAKYEAKLATMTFDGPEYITDKTGHVKQRQDHPVYAAMVESIDDSLGALRATLDELGVSDNTIVILCSDNGGLSSVAAVKTGRELATSNLPLRTGKGWSYEGGVRTPWIVHVPGTTPLGAVSAAPICGYDLYPTLLELCGLPLRPEQHVDGISFTGALSDLAWQRSKPVFWHYHNTKIGTGNTPASAIRDGKWKLIEFYHEGELELYDANNDPGETTDLASQHPDIVASLHGQLVAWRESAGMRTDKLGGKMAKEYDLMMAHRRGEPLPTDDSAKGKGKGKGKK
ncbi:MAG: sulfatase, partial [Planctomycetota bacterium]